jgi:hypothetical protein
MPGKRLKCGFRGVVMKKAFLFAALFIYCSAARAQAPNPPNTRPTTSATAGTNGLGPMWSNGTQAGNNNLTISSNTAI